MISTKRLVRTLVLVALAAVAVTAVMPLAADAAKRTKHGVTSLSPKKGKSVARGTEPKFKVAVRGSGPVYFHVCKRKKLDRNGKLCSGADIDRGKKGKKTKGGGRIYTFRPEDYSFTGYWTVTPGRYYWQAFRIGSCTRGGDCIQEGVVRGIRIK